MKSGAKGTISAAPLDFTGWPRDRARRRARFIGEFLVTPRGQGAGDPFRLRPFQKDIIAGAFALGVRTALVSIPRANGETMLAAALGLAENAKYRQRARVADTLGQRLHTELVRATGRLADPIDLVYSEDGRRRTLHHSATSESAEEETANCGGIPRTNNKFKA